MNGSWSFKQLIIQYSVLTRVSDLNAPAMARLEVEVGVNRRSIPRIYTAWARLTSAPQYGVCSLLTTTYLAHRMVKWQDQRI